MNDRTKVTKLNCSLTQLPDIGPEVKVWTALFMFLSDVRRMETSVGLLLCGSTSPITYKKQRSFITVVRKKVQGDRGKNMKGRKMRKKHGEGGWSLGLTERHVSKVGNSCIARSSDIYIYNVWLLHNTDRARNKNICNISTRRHIYICRHWKGPEKACSCSCWHLALRRILSKDARNASSVFNSRHDRSLLLLYIADAASIRGSFRQNAKDPHSR